MQIRCVFVLLLVACAPVRAQHQMPAPSDHDCRVAANQLASDPHSEAFRRAAGLGQLARCGEIGGRAIADAVRRLDQVSDSLTLGNLTLSAGLNRHPAILAAALDLIKSRSMQADLRIMAMGIALRQHEPSRVLNGRPADLARRPAGRICPLDSDHHVDEHLSSTPLPANYHQALVATLEAVAADQAEPQAIRDLARCIADDVTREDNSADEEP